MVLKVNRPDGWHSWQGMLRRCYYQKNNSWCHYGGRGIKVYGPWRRSFQAFLAYMGPRPSRNHSIDRFPDQNGDYVPGNVRWATQKQQQNNRRNNRRIVANGETMTMAQWSERLGVSIQAMYGRMERGMTPEEAVNYKFPMIEFGGRRLTATEWSKITGIKSNTISKRISMGWTPADALTTSSERDTWKRRRRFK